MSEEQKVDKTELPIKTKIAIFSLFVAAVVIIIGPWVVLSSFSDEAEGSQIFALLFPVTLIIAFLYFISGIFLISKNKWSCKASIVTICFALLASLLVTAAPFLFIWSYNVPLSIIASVPVIVPLILIILDRKNYFEMLRQRESGKK